MTSLQQRPAHPRISLTVAFLASAALACTGGDAATEGRAGATTTGGTTDVITAVLPAPDPVPSPAGPLSGEPNLFAGPAGVYLSWMERTQGNAHALRFARWEDDGWGEPGTVMNREGLFVNWADFPSLAALDDGTLAAHWLEKSGPGPYAYDVRMALSHDGGASWSDDVIPHRDGVQAEHGFVALLPLDDQVAIVWLDGRATVDGEPMTVRFTTVSADGELGPPALLDASVCDCCQTGLARTASGLVVVYRDRTDEEVRDISVVRRVDGEWTEPRTIHDDGWVIPGCPVNGPAIDAAGDDVAVAWFTGAPLDPEAGRQTVRQAGSEGRVLAAFSSDGGATFGEPVRVDEGEAMGRVDLALMDDGRALVVWLERVDGAAEIRARYVDARGAGSSTAITGTAAERASGFPRMVRSGDRVFFAWTEAGENSRVRTATARLGAADGGAQ